MMTSSPHGLPVSVATGLRVVTFGRDFGVMFFCIFFRFIMVHLVFGSKCRDSRWIWEKFGPVFG